MGLSTVYQLETATLIPVVVPEWCMMEEEAERHYSIITVSCMDIDFRAM
jgi:hypothetical protein